MLISPRILFLLGLIVWGTFFFELSFDVHFAVAEFCDWEPFSAAAFESRDNVDIMTLFGVAAGFGVFGFFTDRFGRFHLLLWCLVLAPIASALGAASLTIVDFTILRFLTGSLLGGLLLSSIVLLVEVRNPFFRWKTFAPAIVFVLLIGLMLSRLLPVSSSHWRLSILTTALPALFVTVFRHYHDETKPWKLTVRDAPAHRRTWSDRLFRYRRRLIVACLLSMAGWSVTYGLNAVLRDRLRNSIRYENSLRARDRNDRLEDAALVAYLLRYPPLLDTQEISQLDLASMPEKLVPTTDDLTRCMLEGMIAPVTGKRPANRETLIDNALFHWNRRNGNGRPVEDMLPQEIDRFWKAAELELAEGENRLDEKNIAPEEGRGTLSGANLWEARKSVLKTLLLELRDRHETRWNAEDRELALFGLRFLFGGLVGLVLKNRGEKRFGIRRMSLLFGVMSLIACSGLPLFTPSPLVTEYASLDLYVPLLGFCTVPFLAGLCILASRLFPCSVRASGFGIGLAAGGMVSLLLFSNPSAVWAAPAIPLAILPGVVACSLAKRSKCT